MKKRFNKYALIGFVAIVICTSFFIGKGLILNNDTLSTETALSQNKVVNISASYPKYHPDIKSLYEDADLVVLGRVEKVLPSKKVDSLVFTDSVISVQQYYKNAQEYKNILIQQDGGILNDTEYRNEDLQQFREGETHLLFLKKIFGNKYFIMSPVAKYKIENGQASHIEKARNSSFKDIELELQGLSKKE